MTILQVVPHYLPSHRFGGVLRAAHSLGIEFVADGHEVRVCTTNLLSDNEVVEKRNDVIDGIAVYYAPVSLLRRWGFSPSLAVRLYREIPRADIVIAHFHYQFASVAAGFLARWHRKPFVVFSHGSLHREAIRRRHAWLKRAYLRMFEHANFRRALFVAYQSEEEMQQSLRFGRGLVVPNGVSAARAPQEADDRLAGPWSAPDALRCLFLGRLDPGKGLDVLIPAFAEVVKTEPRARLLIAGADERGYEATVRRLVKEYELQEHVFIPGLLAGPRKDAALRQADLFVLPSRHEGMSVALLEAMDAGLPVVISEGIGLASRITAEDCGKVVPLQAADLALAISTLLADQQARVRMGERGRSLVRRDFTWPRIAREFLQLVRMDSLS